MNFTEEDLDALACRLAPKLIALLTAPPAAHAQPLPFRLTVRMFAACVQRSEEYVRRRIRCRGLAAEGWPYMIHSKELLRFNVDRELAARRLHASGLAPE